MTDLAARLGFEVPHHATDCHMHIFGDPVRFPPAAQRAYDPTPMELDLYNAEAARMGFSRVVFVQASAYGTDNACMMQALRARPGSARAVAVINAATPDYTLAEMAEAGVRGIRLNLVSNGQPDLGQARAALDEAAARAVKLGWHVQIYAKPNLIMPLADTLANMVVPVVIDHMGAVDAGLGVDQPAVAVLSELLGAGNAWVKLSGANRISGLASGFADAVPIMRALVMANPGRAVWGTDWPHIGPHTPGAARTVTYMPHDNLDLLRLLGQAVADPNLLAGVLVDNPARLYGF